MQKITPFLWFDGQAEEAISLYVKLFSSSPDPRPAKVIDIKYWSKSSPFPENQVMTASFEIDGHTYYAFDAGPQFKFSEATSFLVSCDTQEEIDHFWNGFINTGGQESMCGWLKDKFGFSWQIVPPALMKLMADADKEKAGRVMQAMMGMRKLIIADLEAAANNG